jgi:chromosome segregation ATPase
MSELDDRASKLSARHCDLEAATSAQQSLEYEKQSLRESKEQFRTQISELISQISKMAAAKAGREMTYQSFQRLRIELRNPNDEKSRMRFDSGTSVRLPERNFPGIF